MSVTVTFTIPGEEAQKLKDKIHEEAYKRGDSVSAYIVEAVVEYMRKEQHV